MVAEAAASRPEAWTVAGFTDAQPAPHALGRAPWPLLGSDEVLAGQDADRAPAPAALVLGIGGGIRPGSRATIVARLGAARDWATIIHRDASVAPSAALGEGTVIGAAAVVQAGAILGRHVIVNSGAIVEHDVALGDFVHVAPGAVVGGGTTIGAGTFVGLGARVRDHLRLGTEVTVGMGAVVVEDVPDGATVIGLPAAIQRAAVR